MTPRSRPGQLALLILAGLLATGCNVLSLPYFLIMGTDPKFPPELMQFTSQEGKDPKIVILAYAGMETRPEFVQVDNELSGVLAQELAKDFKETRQKVEVVPPGQVRKYKDSHQDWHLDLAHTGKHFEADYVVYLEIESIELYETGRQFYQGQAQISVSVVNVHKPDEHPMKKHLDCIFPKHGPIPVEERNAFEFRQTFLNHIAKHLAWYFTEHSVREEINGD